MKPRLKARIDNRKKLAKQQFYILHMSPQYGELRPTIFYILRKPDVIDLLDQFSM